MNIEVTYADAPHEVWHIRSQGDRLQAVCPPTTTFRSMERVKAFLADLQAHIDTNTERPTQ